MKQYVVSNYKDHRVRFLINMVQRVEYFDQAPIDILFDLIFSLRAVFF